ARPPRRSPDVPATVAPGRTDPVRPWTQGIDERDVAGGTDGDDDRLRDRLRPARRGAAPRPRTPPRPAVLRLGALVHPGLPAARDPLWIPAASDGDRGGAGGGRDPVIHVGTSGWQYADWRGGAFYPKSLPQREWLSFYATRFSTVE